MSSELLPLAVITVVLAAVAVIVWWLVNRSRRQTPIEDEDPGWAPGTSAQGPEILTRESLMNRDRTLDPTRWDDSPDGPATKPAQTNPRAASPRRVDEDDEPADTVDSSFIETLRQRNRDVSGSADARPSGSDENPPPAEQPPGDDRR